jgi:hypothetical protein
MRDWLADISRSLGRVAVVEKFAFAKIFHKHERNQMSLKLLYVPRALIQIRVTNTLNHRLLGL